MVIVKKEINIRDMWELTRSGYPNMNQFIYAYVAFTDEYVARTRPSTSFVRCIALIQEILMAANK